MTAQGGGPANFVRIDPERPDPAILARAGEIIRRGGLVAFPTETVYGLGAHALDAAAVRRIYWAKRRDPSDPLIVHLRAATDVPAVATDMPPIAQALAEHFWPGPLTIVLPKRPVVPDAATAGLPTVAVRVPSHPVAQGLLAAAGVPIAAPSANLFMRTSATTAQHVLDDLGERVDLVLDGGPAPHGIESTVLAVSNSEARLLRPGATTAEAIAEVLAGLEPPVPLLFGTRGMTASPGLMAKHYSPNALVLLFSGLAEETRAAMHTAARDALARGDHVGLLLVDEDLPAFADLPCNDETEPGSDARVTIERLGSERDLAGVASRLFAAMRDLDARGADTIIVRGLGEAGLGRAILDRLTRAAATGVDAQDDDPR